MPLPLLPTSLVGSYAQPDWLIDREKLASRFRRACAPKELWRVRARVARAGAGRRDAARHPRPGARRARHHHRRRDAPRELFQPLRHRARRRRHRQSRHHARPQRPRRSRCRASSARSRRKHPVQVRDVQFLRANTDRTIKITVPGPFTMAQQAQNDFYEDEEALALDYAAAVNDEIKDLFAAGADVVQIDEPYMQARPDKAREYGLKALNRALDGVKGTTAVHICFGYAAVDPRAARGLLVPAGARSDSPVQQISIETAQSKLDCAVLETLPGKTIILGVLDLSDTTVETPETVAARIRRALPHVPAERIIVAPDCGLKYLPREVAFGKMKAMVDGAGIVRRELGAG